MINLLKNRLYLFNSKTLSFNSNIYRNFHDEFSSPPPPPPPPPKEKQKPSKPPPAVSSKFQMYKDEDSTIILDISEERMKMQQELDIEQKENDAYAGLNIERGVHGVFDIEDLVEILRRDNAENIFVCSVPKEIKYVDYICVVSGRSYRHRKAMAQFVRKMFKIKRHTGDILPKIEGENSQEWMALDLGNIALHIFAPDVRQKYNLESLWTVGSKFDLDCNKPVDSIVELYERHTMFLSDLKPKKLET